MFCISYGGSIHASVGDWRSLILHLCTEETVPIQYYSETNGTTSKISGRLLTLCLLCTDRTLSPMDSFASELGVPFEIQMEAPHVVDMDKQVCYYVYNISCWFHTFVFEWLCSS